jgi:hypothetical protein
MTVYELVNPSDTYTFEAESLEIAALAVVILGDGWYGATDEAGKTVVPILALDPVERVKTWWTQSFGDDFDDAIDAVRTDAALRRDLTACLRSVLIGSRGMWDVILGAAAKMTNDDAAAFLADWHDKQRTSTSDIGATAKAWAEQLEAIV